MLFTSGGKAVSNNAHGIYKVKLDAISNTLMVFLRVHSERCNFNQMLKLWSLAARGDSKYLGKIKLNLWKCLPSTFGIAGCYSKAFKKLVLEAIKLFRLRYFKFQKFRPRCARKALHFGSAIACWNKICPLFIWTNRLVRRKLSWCMIVREQLCVSNIRRNQLTQSRAAEVSH